MLCAAFLFTNYRIFSTSVTVAWFLCGFRVYCTVVVTSVSRLKRKGERCDCTAVNNSCSFLGADLVIYVDGEIS